MSELEWWEGENERIDPLPHRHPKGFELSSQRAVCPTCGEDGKVVTQHVTEHAACIECKQHAACWKCKIRFTSHTRFYGQYWMFLGDHGWQRVEGKRSIRYKAKALLRKIFYK